ncbi:hypothetical protein NF347_05125 [Paramuribaculum intestinale]|uniref:hypothetical protein n=1 Tax=Paramuribaculum intestinale TaxID=2094151 RepID=UPI002741AF51|nr:hypothetical protein [Paramuribaculum intestinale]WLT42924.1 hypothetical protein NF347_05125 [Paramuribaculum intestinale]
MAPVRVYHGAESPCLGFTPDLSGWSVEGFLRQGARIHADVEDFLRHVIESKTHPEQAYKSCKGILSFASRVGNDRLAGQPAAASRILRTLQLQRRRLDTAQPS